MSDLAGKVEDAFLRILAEDPDAETPILGDIRLYRGLTFEKRIDPAATCHFLGGNEDPIGTGNYFDNAGVTVASTSDPDTDVPDNPLTAHNANCQAVFDLIQVTNLAALLSAALANFHVFGVLAFERQATQNDGRLLTTMLTVRIYACEVDIS